jgi:protein-disulfide isomerase
MSKKSNPLTRRRGMSSNFVLTAIVLIVAIAVIGGVLVFHGDNNKQGGAASAARAEALRKPDSHTLSEARGDKVTVVEFLDYQCPSCAAYYKNLTKQIEHEYAGRITFVTRNFPLDVHPLAMPAGQAAEAAALQGKYQQMYRALFDQYDSWAVASDGENVSQDEQRARARFDEFGRQIGLDLARFHQDMASPQVTERIERDKADGQKAGVSGTPTLFINGKQFEASGQTFQDVAGQFRAEIDKELAR